MLQEAFQILLELMRNNFAALNIPEENRAENKSVVISSPKILLKISSQNSVIFRNRLSLKICKFLKNHRSEEIPVFEIVLPIFRNTWPADRSIMNINANSLEDSHEPMEIEEISYTEQIEANIPFIKKEKEFTDVGDSKPKTILRESKLTRVLGGNKSAVDLKDDKKSEIRNSENSKLRDIKTETSESKTTKSNIRPLVKKEENLSKGKEKSNFFDFWQILFVVLFPTAILITCVCIARGEFSGETCAHIFNASKAIKELENRVFGQTRAIQELSLHIGLNSSGLKILGIIGGTGVGKSYAAHIIGENFPSKKKMFQYVPPLKPRRRLASNAISVCGCNLIILENLNNKDISEAADFVEYLAGKIDNENYCLFIIEVINIQKTDNNLKHDINLAESTEEIKNIYRNKNLDIKIVQFDHLDDEAITKCIIDAAKNRNLTLTKSEIDDVRISLKISDSGCKGARAKVQLLDKKFDFI